MRYRKVKNLPRKAASAALAFIALSTPMTAMTDGNATIPANPDVKGAFDDIKKAYHFREAQSPLLLKEFLEEYPVSPYSDYATLMLADWYFYNKEFPMAFSWYSKLRDNAFSGDVREGFLYRKAFSMVKTGYYNEAAIYFGQLYNSQEFGAPSRFYIAYIDYVNGNYDDAYDRFQKIKSEGYKGAEAEYYLNQIEYLRGNYQKVATTSERLLSGNSVPDELMAETLRVGGLSFFKLGDKVSARNILARYAELTGDGAELAAIYSLATIYYDEGNYSKALPLFSAITDYPGDLAQSSWLYIGQIYLSQGDPQAAALAFDKAAKESWNQEVAETASYNLAVSSTSGNSLPFSDAAMAMEKFIDTYPASQYSSSLSSYLANAYYNRRDYIKALNLIDKISPQNATTRSMRQKVLYQLGVTQLQQGEISGAIKSLAEAATPSSPDPEVAAQASLWLGDAYYAKKDYKAAAKAYETAINSEKLSDNKALAYYNLGYSYLKLGNYSKAESAFKKAVSTKGLNPEQTAEARLRYGDCLYYTGKYSEALNIFRDIKLGGGSDGVFAAVREADILGRNGKVSDKISILEGLLQNPDIGIWRSTVLSRLADAYSEKGDDKKAAELYAMMIDANGRGDNSQSYFSLASSADNLFNSGDMESALAAYKRLEQSGITDLYPSAVMGILKTSKDNAEIAEYAEKAASLPGLSAEERNEVVFAGAKASLSLSGPARSRALYTLRDLAYSTDRSIAPQAAVLLGEELLRDGDLAGAEEVLLNLIDNGSDDNYWLARGYIALADVYAAQDKDYLARLYLETLQSNYPGKEKDINNMINSRLKSLGK